MAGKTAGGGLSPLEENIGTDIAESGGDSGPDVGPVDGPVSIPAGPNDPTQSIGGVDFVPNQSDTVFPDINTEAALIPEGLGPLDTIIGVLTGVAAGKTALQIAEEEGISTAAEYAIEMAVEKLFHEGRSPFHRQTGVGTDHPDAGVPGGTSKGGSSMDQ